MLDYLADFKYQELGEHDPFLTFADSEISEGPMILNEISRAWNERD